MKRRLTLHRRQLALWLAEWNLDQVLRRAAPDHTAVTPPASETHAWPGRLHTYGSHLPITPCVGDVRLLTPRPGTASNIRPVYAAVLADREQEGMLIVPFSRFALPAVPGEWSTGLRAPALRVLCLWAAKWVESTALAGSWRACRLPARFIGQAMEVRRHVDQGTSLSSVSARSLGPPLLHPLDPRRVYLAEEAGVLDQFAVPPVGHSNGVAGDASRDEWRIAAEPRPPYGGGHKTLDDPDPNGNLPGGR
jgi:hypothetical protein